MTRETLIEIVAQTVYKTDYDDPRWEDLPAVSRSSYMRYGRYALLALEEAGVRLEDGWRPIEAAGDDILHKEVLVSSPKHYDCIVGIKSHLAETFLSEREQERSELSEDDLWQIDWFDAKTGERLEGDIAPTHWRPLPQPPETGHE